MRRTEPLLPDENGTDPLLEPAPGPGGVTGERTLATPAGGGHPAPPWGPPGGPTSADAGGAIERTEVLNAGPAPRKRGVELTAGQVLDGRYRLVQPIGAGGMGEVWEVAREGLQTPLALKILKDSGADHIKVERFLREARAVAMLDHANIVRVTDFGHTQDGLPFFVMEHLRGFTLGELIRKDGAMAWPRARILLTQIADALAVAHGQGIIHRDLKPSNVFVTGEPGRELCKIIDFGIAKFSEVHEDLRTLTQTGIVQGTPAYMSPEQARGEKVDHRTDQYSLGIIAYYLLSGMSPFAAGNVRDTMYRQVFKHPDPLRSRVPDLPESVEAVVHRLLRKNAGLRFETMADALAAIQAMGEGAPPVDVPAEHLPSLSAVAPRPASEVGVTASGMVEVEPTPTPRRGGALVVAVAVGMLVGVGTVMAVLLARGGPESGDAPPPSVTQPVTAPPAAAEPSRPAARPSPLAPEPVSPPAVEVREDPTPDPAQEEPAGEPRGRKKRKKPARPARPSADPPSTPPPRDDNLPPVDPALSDPFKRG